MSRRHTTGLSRLASVALAVVAGACNPLFGIDQLRFDRPSGDGASGAGAGGSSDGGGGNDPAPECETVADCATPLPCVDGVCCDTACDGLCQACNLPAKKGTCAPLPAGTDPANECDDGACDGNGACMTCDSAAPSVGGECPSGCSTCHAGVCRISCDDSACASKTVSCPNGWACEVTCSQALSCFLATILCPKTGQRCDVACPNASSCSSTTVACGGGPCALACGTAVDSCVGTKLHCAAQSCAASCSGTSEPDVSCGSSCACTGC